MGIYLNPGNISFAKTIRSEIYVDKTQLLSYTNKVLGTKEGFICNSRPRRFGKSTTADMLAAYYSRGCDSEKMFEGLEISRDSDFYTHLNRYEVIRIDVQWCRTSAKSAAATVTYIEENIIRELQEIYQKVLLPDSLPDALAAVNKVTGQKFIIIIDEWDCLIRDEAENTELLEEYITLLRGLFKGSTPTEFIHLAYLTGILPVKKIKTQSALNNFDEFTMLDAGILAPYVGFTEKEVEALCEKYSKDFKEVKHWYDGYFLQKEHIYNPKAVVSVMMRGNFKSYWSLTGTYESILPLISMDFDGLKTDIIKMLSGDSVKVEVDSFQNDMVTFQDKDDVLTLLIHLGYLAYDETKETAFIPNEEIRSEFSKATRRKKWNELTELYVRSNELLQSTLNMDSNAVAELIERFHMDYTSALQYNNENSLSSVLSIAYLSAMQYYFKPVREMPAGRGFADLVFLPKKEYPELPALLMELKWNKSAEGAIRQVKERKYVKTLENYTGEILLIGINYSKKEKRHQCVIEKR